MKGVILTDGYIMALTTGSGTTVISDDEYNALVEKIMSKPTDTEGFQYKLRADNLEWELVKLPPIKPEPLTNEEVLTRYANELTGQNDPDLISAAETLIEQRIKEDTV